MDDAAADAAKAAVFLTSVELQARIEAFDQATWSRLDEIADAYAKVNRVNAAEVMQEAFVRALNGKRRCPSNVDVVAFIAQTMRSVASNVRKKATVARKVSLKLHAENAATPSAKAPALFENDGDEDHAAKVVQEILDLFADDEVALLILEGMMDGIEGTELKDLSGLSSTDYDSKRRMIRRRINKRFPTGAER